jgi:hypothetical protein
MLIASSSLGRTYLLRCMLGSFAVLPLSACAPRATTATTQQTPPRVAALPSASQADVVTVIPFTLADLPSMSMPLFIAEVNGHRGLFGLDVGDPTGVVNRFYLKPNATGGLDTVLAGEAMPQAGEYAQVTLRLGSLQSPTPIRTQVLSDPAAAQGDHRLGNIGVSELEPYEAIIDYTHQRLVLIRLDHAGHRLAQVPGYTPVATLPLISIDNGHVAVQGRIGDVVDTLALDTGNPIPVILTPTTRQRVQAHLAGGMMLDHLVIGSRSFDSLLVAPALPYMPDIIGYPVLHQYGAVGLNQRTHQLMLYR